MEFDKEKIKDYATTGLLMLGAALVAYQPQVLAHVPAEYSLVAVIILGMISQITADQRAKVKIQEGLDAVDEVQAEVAKYEVVVADLQKEVDEKQAEIERVAGLKELDAA